MEYDLTWEPFSSVRTGAEELCDQYLEERYSMITGIYKGYEGDEIIEYIESLIQADFTKPGERIPSGTVTYHGAPIHIGDVCEAWHRSPHGFGCSLAFSRSRMNG